MIKKSPTNYKCLLNKQFNRWTVISKAGNDKAGRALWLCRCSCDRQTEKIVAGYSLRGGQSLSCGCYCKEQVTKAKLNDLTGKIFGKLTVLGRVKEKTKSIQWICQCSCDNKTIINVFGNNLYRNHTKSCGCINKLTGPDHPSWDHTITNEERNVSRDRLIPGYKGWKKKIYAKNFYKCVICHSKENICAHHLESYKSNPNLRLDLNNGITLCRKCHLKFHTKYGNVNNTRLEFEEFVKELTNE